MHSCSRSKALEYASEASQISTSINMNSQQAKAERLAFRILSSCTRRDTPPPGSERIQPYDGQEGLNEEQVSLGTGTGASDMANLGASDVANLLDLSRLRNPWTCCGTANWSMYRTATKA